MDSTMILPPLPASDTPAFGNASGPSSWPALPPLQGGMDAASFSQLMDQPLSGVGDVQVISAGKSASDSVITQGLNAVYESMTQSSEQVESLFQRISSTMSPSDLIELQYRISGVTLQIETTVAVTKKGEDNMRQLTTGQQ